MQKNHYPHILIYHRLLILAQINKAMMACMYVPHSISLRQREQLQENHKPSQIKVSPSRVSVDQ